jgi:hypothetical protein
MADRDFRIDLLMRAQFDQAKKALDDADRKLGSIGKTLDQVNARGVSLGGVLRGVAVGAAAVATAGVAVMGLYIARTIEAEKVQAQLGARVKDTAGIAGRSLEQLNEQASRLQAATTFDDEAIGSAQAMLLTFTQIRGLNFDRTIESATDLATVMGVDVTDAAKILGKALSDPEQGLGALRKAGVTFTDAETEVIKKMVDAGQIAEAQSVILDKLQSTMGGAAEAARDTLGGALQALKNSFDNLLEGDAKDGGLRGTRDAIEALNATMNDPNVKKGFDTIAAGAANVAAQVFNGIGALDRLIEKYRLIGSISDKVAKNAPASAFTDEELRVRLANLSEQKSKALRAGDEEAVARLQGMITTLIREGTRRIKDEIAHPDFSGVIGTAVGSFEKPAGEGVAKPPKPSGSKSDPNADIKRRIESLREETALLGQIKQGEDKASEAAKARYDTTEGEFKNKSPQLKAELVAAAEALDAANARRAAEEKAKEALEETKKAYGDLLQELRTPAEVAVDDAIAKLDTLNKALQAGVANKGALDDTLKRIADSAFDKAPDFNGLSPEVGGAFSELTRVDQARAQLETWYQEQLQKLAAFRQKRADLNAQWDAEEETLEAEHQAKLQQLQSAQAQVMLAGASQMFGNLADIAKAYGGEQSKTYRALFALSKGFAVAQAALALAQNVAEASKYGFPQNIPFIAGALAQGAQIASLLAGANFGGGGGFAEGGYTGPGGKYQVKGVVHAGEGVLSQEEISALGGPAGFFALREAIENGLMRERIHAWAGYADGGLVGARGPVSSPDWAALDRGRAAAFAGQPSINRLSLYNLFDMDELAQRIANHPVMEKRIVVVAGENGAAIRQEW